MISRYHIVISSQGNSLELIREHRRLRFLRDHLAENEPIRRRPVWNDHRAAEVRRFDEYRNRCVEFLVEACGKPGVGDQRGGENFVSSGVFGEQRANPAVEQVERFLFAAAFGFEELDISVRQGARPEWQEAARLLRQIITDSKKRIRQELLEKLRDAEEVGDDKKSDELRQQLHQLIKETAHG